MRKACVPYPIIIDDVHYASMFQASIDTGLTYKTVWQKIKYKFMKHRLEYVDALRGLAILLVVFMHVPQYGFGQSIGGYYMEMAILLAVPLFFFISGLFVPLEITPPFQ